MILSANQPYFFPYLPFYQMVYHSDVFVSADCVNFCKKKFINKNIISDKRGNKITILLPLKDVSSYKKINQVLIYDFDKTIETLLKKILITYGRKNTDVFELVKNCFTSDRISEVSTNSIRGVFEYLEIKKQVLVCSDDCNLEDNLTKELRIYKLCQQTHCDEYLNLIGGKNLYKKSEFEKMGIKLNFLQTKLSLSTSILDLLFRYSKEEVKNFLTQYTLI